MALRVPHYRLHLNTQKGTRARQIASGVGYIIRCDTMVNKVEMETREEKLLEFLFSTEPL